MGTNHRENQPTESASVDSPELPLPEALAGGSVDRCCERLRDEWRPTTPTQEFLVREMARHEAALDRAEQIEAAILRRGSRGAPRIPSDLTSAAAQADAALAAAGITDALEKISAYRRSHERAFHRSYAILSELKAAAAERQAPEPVQQAAGFASETECEQHLISSWRCPDCGSASGHWIASRRVCACGACHRQSSLRAGTVAARSGLPLLVWFNAVAALRANPDISTAELAAATGIRRAATVRSMSRRIRQAMTSADATRLLMGLDRVPPSAPPSRPLQSGVPGK